MRRLASCLLGLSLCYGLTGCDTGGPPVGPATDVSGATTPPGFEDMMKKTGGAMGKPGSAFKDQAGTKEAAKEASKEAAKEATKEASKEAAKEAAK
jgi:hypothetical protein